MCDLRFVLWLNCIFYMLISINGQGNKYPIVLVHGFFGWGRDEMLGIKYFGGLQGDFEYELRKQGYEVYSVGIGPISSNWDRACELFAQIKGGQVDYGTAHGKKYKHANKGRSYPGLYKQWGTKDENGNIRKIHLIGHSMGGQTSRMLAQLLHQGTKGSPIEETSNHILFEGGHADWIHSITTISTPHEGTLLSNGFLNVAGPIKNLVGGLLSIAGMFGKISTALYDFKLDQWNLKPKQSNENLSQYFHRVLNSGLFTPGAEDTSLYDLTTYGAKLMNSWVHNVPFIYYYSYATEDTYGMKVLRNWRFRNVQKPRILSMLLPLQPVSYYLGDVEATTNKGFSENWQKNDGIVNSISMKGPFRDEIVEFNGISKPGRWHFVSWLNKMDHLAICGWTILRKPISVYSKHIRMLHSLPIHPPKKTSNKRELYEEFHTKSFIVDELKNSLKELNIASDKLQDSKEVIEFCKQAKDSMSKTYCSKILQLHHRNLRTV